MPPKSPKNRITSFLLKRFFYLLYHQFAWTYDFISGIVSLGMWKDWVFATLPYISGKRVLELGHGPGHLQIKLMEKEFCAFGIDESQQMVRHAYKQLSKANYEPQVMRGRSNSLPFKDESLHNIVSTFPTDYIYNSDTLSEVYRVLSKDGTLIIIPVAWITGTQRLARLMSWLFRTTGQSPEWDDRYLKPFINAGFNTQVHKIDIRLSKVLVIIASKP